MKTTIYFVLAAVLILTGCAEYEKEITWKLDEHQDMLVVEGNITNEFGQQMIFLAKTSPYFDTSAPKAISGAGVVVREGSNTYYYTESATQQGLYLSDISFAGEALKTYELEVVLAEPLNGLTDYRAISKMPEGIDLDTIICEIYEMPDLGFEEDEDSDTTILSIAFFGKEPDDPNNYYTARIFQNKTCWNSNVKEVYLYNDDNNNGSNHDYFILNENVESEDTIMLEIRSVEKNYYDFVNGIQLIDGSGDAYSMSGPPANAVGNISGGKALGFFSAAYISRATSIAVDMRGKK